MKTLNLKLILALMVAIPLMFLSSCETDDGGGGGEDTNEFLPVKGENFEVEVVGNNVNLTTEISGNVWATVNEVDHPFVDGKVTVNLPTEGTYAFTVSSQGSGATLTSEPFNVVIEQTDLSFCEEEGSIWNALTGGPEVTKTWVLDLEGKYFHNPVDFYGDSEVGGASDNIWGPWGGFTIDSPEQGYISFTCDGTVNLNLHGDDYTGTFSLDIYDRDPDFLTLSSGVSLWENMETGQYSYLGELSSQMADLSLSGDSIRFPIQSDRYNEDQFDMEDLQAPVLMHVSDSGIVVRIKREREGGNPSAVWMLYNYIVQEYDYPEGEVFTYTEPVLTSFTAEDLVGTWEFAEVSEDWIGWYAEGNQGTIHEAKRLNNYTSKEEMVTLFTSWGASNPDSVYTATADNQYVFNADGTCVLAGVENTYTVSDGIITFGTELTDEFQQVMIGLSGTEVPVLDVVNDADNNPYTYEGIWIGQKNGDLNESAALHLIMQE